VAFQLTDSGRAILIGLGDVASQETALGGPHSTISTPAEASSTTGSSDLAELAGLS